MRVVKRLHDTFIHVVWNRGERARKSCGSGIVRGLYEKQASAEAQREDRGMRGDEVFGGNFLAAGLEGLIALESDEIVVQRACVAHGEYRGAIDGERPVKEIVKIAAFEPEEARHDGEAEESGEDVIAGEAAYGRSEKAVGHEVLR